MSAVVVFDDTQRGRDHSLVVGSGDRRLFQVDIQTIKAVGFHLTDDLICKRLLLAFTQFDVRISAAQRQQYRATLAVQLSNLCDELAFTHANSRIQLKRRDRIAAVHFHKGDINHVVLWVDLIKLHTWRNTAFVTGAIAPVMPVTHHHTG